MALTYAQLTQPIAFGAMQTLILNALQGIGIISQANASGGQGAGTGSVSYVSGTPNNSYTAVIKISTSGEPGTGQFQFATDGVTFGGAVTIPTGNGQYTLGSTGIIVAFAAGPAGAGTSFVIGDTYSFSLSSPNFPVTAWQTGSVYRTLSAIEAQVLSSLSSLVANIGAGGLAATATGSWADLLGTNVYALARNGAVAAVGTLTLTDSSNVGPFSVAAGAMYIADTQGHRYINNASFTIPKNSSVTGVIFTAEAAGGAYNSTPTQIVVNTLPGVTLSTWALTTNGVDGELDAAYMSRCLARWPALGPGATAATYDLWARTASANITRTIVVTDATVAGQVDVYCAGVSGASAGGDVAAALAYIQQRAPLAVLPNVVAATNVPITIQTTVTYRSSVTTLAAVQSGINTALTNYFNSALMGKDSGGTVKLYLDQIRDQIMNVTGVVSCDPFVSPVADTALTTGQCATIAAASNIGTTWAGWTFTAI